MEFDREGEAYESRRFRVGVVGGAEEVDARTGDGARWTGVVTSECSTDVKMELACSAVGSKLVQLSIEGPELVGRRSGMKQAYL